MSISETKVVNVRVKHIRPEYHNLKIWTQDSKNEYIGRKGIVFIKNSEGKKERFPKNNSIFHNPFKGENVCEKFEVYIRNRIKTEPKLKEQLLKLKGKRLGCWCKPKECHGDVLVRLIKEYSV